MLKKRKWKKVLHVFLRSIIIFTMSKYNIIFTADDDSGGEESVPSDSESEEEEEDEEDEDGSQAKLWPSLNVRTRWIQATNDSVTVAEVSLALLSLINSARGYGVVGEDPLAGMFK